MPVLIQYLPGYGWHMGRLLLWPLLFFSGAALTFVLVLGGQLACAVYKWPGLYSLFPPLLVPLTFSFILYGRVRRKLAGEPYVVNLPDRLSPGTSSWLVERGHRHFRVLLMLDLLIWVSSILAQIGVAAAPLVAHVTR